MTLVRKVIAGYAVVVALLVVIVGVSVYDTVSAQRGEDQVAAAVARAEAGEHLRYAIRDGIAAGLEGAVFEDQRDEHAKDLDAALAQFDALVASFPALGGNAQDVAAQQQIVAKGRAWQGIVRQVRSELAAGRPPSLALLAALHEDGTEVANLSSEMVAEAVKDQDTLAAELAAASGRRIVIILVLAALAIVAAVVTAFIVVRSITRSLRAVIDKLMTSSAELLAVSGQVAASSSETGASIMETTTTVREVKQTAEMATQKAAAVREAADETSRITEAGSQSVEETISGIERMGEQMGVVTESIVRLSDQTAAISEVIATVKDLAEQSNLLSVNAAIEAAKAGDQGKGFAVVAQEVRNLADQSKQAVAQVRDILTDIQKATTAAVLATELGSKSIERGAAQSLESGRAIEQLAASVAQAIQAIRQTAATSEQQLAGMDQISAAMEAIGEASSQNVAGSRQVEAEVQQLRDVATELESLLDRHALVPA